MPSHTRTEQFLERIRRLDRINLVPRSRLRDRINPLENYDSEQFKARFHMNKDTAKFIVDLIKDDLCAPVRRGLQLPPLLQFLYVCRFYASGSFQLMVADLHEVNQSTISKLINRVSRAIAKHTQKYIKFPTDPNEVRNVRGKFQELGGFPGVTGAIDCTHVKIDSPGGDTAELFRNRKGYFSVNVQAVCGPELQFYNFVVRWYGSAHDSRIFEESVFYDQLETKTVPGLLLGDGGYPCLPFIVTPFIGKTLSIPQKRYNKAHCTTRNTVERSFGVLKRRFPCLNHLRLKLQTSLIVITAVGVLHNIVRQRNDIYEDDESADTQNIEIVLAQNTSTSGRLLRDSIVRNHFSQ